MSCGSSSGLDQGCLVLQSFSKSLSCYFTVKTLYFEDLYPTFAAYRQNDAFICLPISGRSLYGNMQALIGNGHVRHLRMMVYASDCDCIW